MSLHQPQANDRKAPPARIGEVVEASTARFAAQCYRLYDGPPLGSLVRCGDESPIYGIVCEVTTQSMDPGRRPAPRGHDEETEEGVYLSNPQLSRLLQTEIRCVSVGHRVNGQLLRHPSLLPPRILSFVYWTGDDELREFTGSLDFMPNLLADSVDASDEVIAAFLRRSSKAWPEPERFLVDAGRQLATLLAGEIQRLNNLLRRVSS